MTEFKFHAIDPMSQWDVVDGLSYAKYLQYQPAVHAALLDPEQYAYINNPVLIAKDGVLLERPRLMTNEEVEQMHVDNAERILSEVPDEPP